MKIYRAFLLIFAVMFTPANELAQTHQPAKNPAGSVVEVVRESWAHGRVSAYILRLYKSGRVDYEAASRRTGEEKYHTEKTVTSQVALKKISELIGLAEQEAVKNAKETYRAFSAGIDAGRSAKVIFFRKTGKQTIELAPFFTRRGQTAEVLPLALREFLKKVSEVENLMEGKLRK